MTATTRILSIILAAAVCFLFLIVAPDPLDGASRAPLHAGGPDWVLVFIVTAIGMLSAGIAFVIIRKPQR